MSNNGICKIGKLNQESTALFICDIQTCFLKTAKEIQSIIVNNKCLIKSCKEFNIPIIMTKHDTSEFGEIIDDLLNCVETTKSAKIIEKISYSMWNEELSEYVKEKHPNLKSVILTGIESSVCVAQTAFDLLESGYEVHVILDATTGVDPKEFKLSIKRMKQSNVFITTTEAIIYQLLLKDSLISFKEIIKILDIRKNELLNLEENKI